MNQEKLIKATSPNTKLEKPFRILLSIMFLMTGMMKLALPFFGNAFLIQLNEAQIPFPELNFWIVPIVELTIGLLLLINFQTIIALTSIVPIMLVAIYVHLVVSNPAAFPAQPQFPIMPILILMMVVYLLYNHFKRFKHI